jgi:DNA helicase-2/ATP-dependent DNA helicase PcrA
MGLGDIIRNEGQEAAKPAPPSNAEEIAEKLLAGLNPEQTEVVLHEEGSLLVVAVAGSGKTRALVHRLAYLVKVRGVDPSRILAVTFSRKGAQEMQDRLVKLIGDSGARVGTFHSLGLQILRAEKAEYREWTIDDRNRYKFCVKDAAGFRELDWKTADITLIESFIGRCKCDLARPYSERAEELAQQYLAEYGFRVADPQMLMMVYERAEELRRERQLLTFDDMLMESVELLRDDEGIRKRWASKWSFVMQDEAQDQNYGQLLMGELLAQDHKNYALIGDPNQTIFTWRGAMPQMLLTFEERWSAKVVKMSRNYRCGRQVIDTANRMIGHMAPENKLDIEMVCELGTDSAINTVLYEDLDDEAGAMAARVQELLTDGMAPRNVAILYRTNAQSRAPEEALISARIPYVIIGGTNFYERKEVRDLLAYLKLAEGRGDLDDVQRCINSPFRYLGKAFVQQVRDAVKEARRKARSQEGARVSYPGVVRRVCSEGQRIQSRQRYSAEEWANLVEETHRLIKEGEEARARIKSGEFSELDERAVTESKPDRILEIIVRESRYTDWLVRAEGQETTENNRVSNVRELVRAAGRFTTVAELLDYIELTIKASREQRKKGDTPNKVVLTTLHRSKGLEWPVVFIVGTNEGILPHAKAEDDEEERRLFYVGVTRAKMELNVSCIRVAALGNRVLFLPPSRFIDEGGLTLADQSIPM